MSKTQKNGRIGELFAQNYLKTHGYVLLATNYHCRYGEIDIVAFKEGILEFIEVRTRTKNSLNLPEESLTRLKLLHIRRSVADFLQNRLKIIQQNLGIRSWRISLVGIILNANGVPISLTRTPIN